MLLACFPLLPWDPRHLCGRCRLAYIAALHVKATQLQPAPGGSFQMGTAVGYGETDPKDRRSHPCPKQQSRAMMGVPSLASLPVGSCVARSLSAPADTLWAGEHGRAPGLSRQVPRGLSYVLRRLGVEQRRRVGEKQTLALTKLADHPLFPPLQGLRGPRHQVVSIPGPWMGGRGGLSLELPRLARGNPPHSPPEGDPKSVGGAWGIPK